MQIIFIRHGESEANAQKVLQGHMDSPLSEIGRSQAKALAPRIQIRRFDYIYSSDLSRAAETAKIICDPSEASKIIYTPLLREMALGEFEGKAIELMEDKEREYFQSFFNETSQPIPNGESVEQFIHRLKKFLRTIDELNPPPQHILVVAHGGVIFTILKRIMKILPDFQNDEWFENCRINEIQKIENGNWIVKSINGRII